MSRSARRPCRGAARRGTGDDPRPRPARRRGGSGRRAARPAGWALWRPAGRAAGHDGDAVVSAMIAPTGGARRALYATHGAALGLLLDRTEAAPAPPAAGPPAPA